MIFKKLFVIINIFLLILLSLSAVGLKNTLSIKDDQTAEKPEWCIGNYWQYDMDFDFLNKDKDNKVVFKVDAEILDMYANYTEDIVENNENLKVLSIDGKIKGIVNLLGIIDIAELNGDLTGHAYIDSDNFGIKEFKFNVDGFLDFLGNRKFNFNMEMNFDPCFNFFDFPIGKNEDLWQVQIDDATLKADVFIGILGGYSMEYINSTSFLDNMTVNSVKNLNIPNIGTYESYVIGGTWGSVSELYYVEDLGYLGKVKETLNWKDDEGAIQAGFDLLLKDTNYIKTNSPPETPLKPSGPIEGEEDTLLYYLTFTKDPDNDQVFYLFDWDDGTESEWIGPFDSEENIETSHDWHNRGVYNVKVKAKDVYGYESDWSEPKIVTITGDSLIFLTINKILSKDELDICEEPELYYKIYLLGNEEPIGSAYHTDDGKWTGEWITNKTWMPNIIHTTKITNRNPVVKIKVMDRDPDMFGTDDLADVSGCPGDGVNDGTPDVRGAIYHGTYDMVTHELLPVSYDILDYSDEYVKSDDIGEYITSGDYKQDSSTDFEGGIIPDPENDAKVWFTIDDDYINPTVNAKIVNAPEIIKTTDTIKFQGSVKNGAPNYNWFWDFGDGFTSTDQNPSHRFEIYGSHLITLTLTDGFGETSTTNLQINVEKNNKPINLKITGPTDIEEDKSYDFTFSAEEMDGDKLYYQIDWDDGGITDWLGPYESGFTIQDSHAWTSKGNYQIEFSAKDEYDEISTKTFDISLPKTKMLKRYGLFDFLQNIINLIFQNKIFLDK